MLDVLSAVLVICLLFFPLVVCLRGVMQRMLDVLIAVLVVCLLFFPLVCLRGVGPAEMLLVDVFLFYALQYTFFLP